SITQLPCIDDPRAVLLKERYPARRVGWLNGMNGREDGNADGIRNLVALPQAPGVAGDRQHSDDSHNPAHYETDPSLNDQVLPQWGSRGVHRGLENSRLHSRDWVLRGTKVIDVAVRDRVRGVLCLGGGLTLGADRDNGRAQVPDLDAALQCLQRRRLVQLGD